MSAVGLVLRIILQNPTQSVAYGIQKGRTHRHEMVQTQIANSGNLDFEIVVEVKKDKNDSWQIAGPFVQGKPSERFIYIGIGTFAGQQASPWSRRLKIPLTGIEDLFPGNLNYQAIVETKIPGTGKDGTPNCATVKPFDGWTLIAEEN